MRRTVFVGLGLILAGAVCAQTVQVDLSSLFDRDTILAPGEDAATGGDFDGIDADIGTGYALVQEG